MPFCALSRRNTGKKTEKVILFGSVARGEFDEESDVDIKIVLKNGSKKTAGRDKCGVL